MQIIDDIPVFGEPVDIGALEQIKNARNAGAERVALMADHHLGFGVPIGGVVAFRDLISPGGVGFDIACGNKAVRLDCPGREVRNHIHRIIEEVFKKISFGVGRNNDEDVDHELFDDEAWNQSAAKALKDKARNQLGTVGGGNHYVDIFIDEEDRPWIGVHFGSRGFGHGIATFFNKISDEEGRTKSGITMLDAGSQAGEDYLACMELAGRYAYAGRDWVCNKVAKIVGAKIVDEVHNHHNFAWREEHFGEQMWVVRKGATPAFPGQRGFVGASMAETSVILEGVASAQSEFTLCSTVHGAGRIMSRKAAKGDKKKGLSGRVSRIAMDQAVREAGVVLKGGDVDESMQCYKRLDEVLESHKESVRVLHRLKPIGVAMAGADVFDPFKD